MKKTIITLIATLGLALGTTAAAAASTTAKFAASPIMTGALSASSGFPTKCPPAAPVGKALGLSVSGPTVVSYAAGLALECQYASGQNKFTVTWEKESRAGFLAEEKFLGVKPVTGLGAGVAAYSTASLNLMFQKGSLGCTIEAYGISFKRIESLAEVLLRHYW
jgi:hypothetical protein